MNQDKAFTDSGKGVSITLLFHPLLRPLLAGPYRQKESITRTLGQHTSIKDAIEALDVPHTEIGRLLVNDSEVGFSYRPAAKNHIQVLPPPLPADPCRAAKTAPQPLPCLRFLVDVNVGKLCGSLRMLGMDTLYHPHLSDSALAQLAAKEHCVVLSRDRGLLRRKIITHGHLLRSQDPMEQLAELIYYYGLERRIAPFSRCMHCNSLLAPVTKTQVEHRLEPLTKQYYQEFSRCLQCGKVYWAGSHRIAMEQSVDAALQLSRNQSAMDRLFFDKTG